jgi:hypothetical protein
VTEQLRPGTWAVRRMTARLLGLLLVLTAPAWLHGALIDQREAMSPWWNAMALVVIGGPLVWMLVVSLRVRDVRPPAVALAAGVALCLVTWPLGVVDVDAVRNGLPWLWLILPLTTSALATVGSVPASLLYGAGVGTPYALIRVQPIGGNGPPLIVLLEAVLVVTQAVGAAVLVAGAARAAARLDAIADDAARASAEAERAATALATRRELDAVVHDTVLAALHTAVRDPRAPELPQLAERAMDTLTSTRHDRVAAARSVPTHELGRRLQTTLSAVAPDADLDVRPGPEVPADVARALTDAALEAARNARRHGGGAGGSPDIGVTVEPSPDGRGLLVTVSDDGIGFDPSLVPPQRMGLAVSVRERMSRVGGRADVVTATGSGTTVRLLWSPEETA